MPTVLEVQNDARSLLNDIYGDMFPDATLLPFTRKAYRELQNEFALNGIGDIFEEDTVTGVAIGVKSIDVTVTIPDLILPLKIWERPELGNDSQWVQMNPQNWDPAIQVGNMMQFWKFEELRIKFPGATVNKELKIRYVKSLTALANTGTSIPILNCQDYLAARVAAIAAVSVGGNIERAEIYQSDANGLRKVLIDTAVKYAQKEPARRQPFRAGN